NGMRIVFYSIGLHRISFVTDLQALGTGIAQVHPQRCGAGAAVKGDKNGTVFIVLHICALIISVKQSGIRLAVLAKHRLCSDKHAIRYLLALDGHFVSRSDDRIGRKTALLGVGNFSEENAQANQDSENSEAATPCI